MEPVEQFARWMHIFAGLIWIGLLYFLNFVNSAFTPTMDGDTKKKVVPELLPRVLFWFRWGAAWSWMTGILLLTIIFYIGGTLFKDYETDWSAAAIIMIAIAFLSTFVYDTLLKSPLGKDIRVGTAVGFVWIAVVLYLMSSWAGFSYRGYVSHTGAMFGTMMVFNVWVRIWPAQQQIIRATKAGEKPAPVLVALVEARSKHNTYLSVPLLWAMTDSHTTFFSGGHWGITEEWAWTTMLFFTALGWLIVWTCYRKATKVKGF